MKCGCAFHINKIICTFLYMKKICIATSSRAEYNLLKNIIITLSNNSNFDVKLIVTGSHLLHSCAHTIDIIKKDKIKIDCEINMDMNNMISNTNYSKNINQEYTPNYISNGIGIQILKLSEYFTNNKFDYILLLGDRYEIMSIAFIATIFNIKIIHLCGGDITTGSFDDAFRNSITHMSYVHLVTCEKSKQRVIELLFDVGGISKKNDYDMAILCKNKNIHIVGHPNLEKLYNFVPNANKYDNYIMFVIHPETKNLQNMDKNLYELEKIFDYILSIGYNIVAIGPNIDTDSNKIINLYNKFIDKIHYFPNLDNNEYLSVAYNAGLFISNSSSGIYEIPVFNKYVLNIGCRQENRAIINNVLNVEFDFNQIKQCISSYFNIPIQHEAVFPMCHTSKLVEDVILRLE